MGMKDIRGVNGVARVQRDSLRAEKRFRDRQAQQDCYVSGVKKSDRQKAYEEKIAAKEAQEILVQLFKEE